MKSLIINSKSYREKSARLKKPLQNHMKLAASICLPSLLPRTWYSGCSQEKCQCSKHFFFVGSSFFSFGILMLVFSKQAFGSMFFISIVFIPANSHVPSPVHPLQQPLTLPTGNIFVCNLSSSMADFLTFWGGA